MTTTNTPTPAPVRTITVSWSGRPDFRGVSGNPQKFSKIVASEIRIDGVPLAGSAVRIKRDETVVATFMLNRAQTDALNGILAAARLRDGSDAHKSAVRALQSSTIVLPAGGKTAENLAADLSDILALDVSDDANDANDTESDS